MPLFPLRPSPTYSITAQPCGLPRPGEHLRLCPLLCNRCAKTKKKMAQMKEQFKAPEKLHLSKEEKKKKKKSKEEVANLSDAQFKTLVIRMLHELTGYFNSIKKTQAIMKIALHEIKKNIQGTNSGGKETRTQSNDLEQKKEINIHPEEKEEPRIQKNEERLRNLQDNFKCSNI